MFRAVAVLIFVIIVITLFTSLFFLLRDRGQTKRTANTLMLRVILSAALILLLLYGFLSGHLHSHVPW